jgi:RND superfamily putative drug exporter
MKTTIDTPAASEASKAQRFSFGQRYGLMIYRGRWLVLAIWLIVWLASLPVASTLPGLLSGGGYTYSNSDSTRVATIQTTVLHQPQSQLFLVFHSNTVPAADPAYQAELSGVASRARSDAHVTQVIDAGAGSDGHTALLVADFDLGADALESHLDAFEQLLPSHPQPATMDVTGGSAIYASLSSVVEQDTEHADGAVLPLALIILLIVFGAVVAAGLPIVLALISVPLALAGIALIAHYQQTSVSVLSVASIIGLGLSIDYSLLMVRRFREEMARGQSTADAVAKMVATAGEAILFSACAVMVGFGAMTLIGMPFMTSIGLAGLLVVLMALLAALTLLPALLSLLGVRINALSLPFMRRWTVESETGTGFWHRLALWVMNHAVPIVVLVSIALLALGWPVLRMQVGIPSATVLPTSVPARQGWDLLQAQFPALAETPVVIVTQTPDGSPALSAQNLAAVDDLTRWLARQSHVTAVTSVTQLPGQSPMSVAQLAQFYASGAYQSDPPLAQFVASNVNGGTTQITLDTNTTLDSPQGIALVDRLRSEATAHSDGLHVLVGGFQAATIDFNGYLYGNFPRAIAFILITTFLLLLALFRSVVLPLKAVLMNILSISVAYGAMVVVFQWGVGSHLLGFTSEGFVESTDPVILFCVLFGLSMDYEVFLLTRIREEWLLTGNNRLAVARGLEKTGGVITSAALILTIVAGAIVTTTTVSSKEIGFGLAVAVLVDASIIRSLMVPALMRLFGRWNWWLPGRPLPVERTMAVN